MSHLISLSAKKFISIFIRLYTIWLVPPVTSGHYFSKLRYHLHSAQVVIEIAPAAYLQCFSFKIQQLIRIHVMKIIKCLSIVNGKRYSVPITAYEVQIHKSILESICSVLNTKSDICLYYWRFSFFPILINFIFQ